MGTARLDIAYDGRRFAGWSSQPGRRTVQGELEAALAQIIGEPARLTVAGRTDAGVHALGQVASFEHRRELPDHLAERLNAVLARDVAVKAAGTAPDGFDARRDARSRTYHYRLLVSRIRRPHEEAMALWWRHRLDRQLLARCATAVTGRHDFTAFTRTQTEHQLFERDIEACEWVEEGPELLTMRVTAPSFMRSQVRVLVGTMLEVGGRRRTLEDFEALLEGAPREHAGETAPPHGLYLVEVAY